MVSVGGRIKRFAASGEIEKAAHDAAIDLVRDNPTAGEHPADWEKATATATVAQLEIAFAEFARKLLGGGV